MNEIPVKIYAVLGLESGLFIGLGVFLFHTLKVVMTATKRHSWQGFRDL